MRAIRNQEHMELVTEPCPIILNKISLCARKNLWEQDYHASQILKIGEKAAIAADPFVARLCPLRSADTKCSDTGRRRSKE